MKSNIRTAVAALALAVSIVALVAPGLQAATKAPSLPAASIDVSVWTDPGTGCQYLVDTPTRYRGSMTPRMQANGKQVCE